MTDDLIGKVIGGYEILNLIGQGGMATVFRAQQISMKRDVALKVLPRQFLNDDTYLQRFEREVNIVSQLEHRNIVPVYDYGQFDDQPYIVMRFMNAGSVDDRLNQGPMNIEMIVKITEQIAPALDYAHSKNVLHRDLKPSNVLLDDDGGAFITDFGIARILGEQGPGITTQGVVGTPSYMSPEQAQAHALDGRSDEYSLGVMLFEMATGRRPFESDTPYGIAVMQVTKQPPTPRSINAAVTPAVERVILKSMRKNPDERFATAVELAEALREAVENPETMKDTQPRPLFVSPPVPQPAVQPAPSYPQHQPQYTPPTPQSSRPVSLTPSQIYPNWRARVQKKRKGNIWWSVALGGLIGCALLTVMVIVGALIIGNLNNDAATRAPTADPNRSGIENGVESSDTSTAPPLDLTSEAARQTLLPGATTEVAITPTESTEPAPVGVRPTATFSPLLSEAAGTIVYFDKHDNVFDIFSINVESRVITQLTAEVGNNSYPNVSPDGSKITFQSSRDGDFEIYTMNMTGGNVHQLTFNEETLDRLPAWSPDGEWVIYSSDTHGDNNHDLYRVNVNSGDTELVFSNGRRNNHARYSPDGRYIVFNSGIHWDASTWEIMRLDTETGTVVQLTNNDIRDAAPVFSPDGEHILYISGNEAEAAIVRMNLDGTDQQEIYNDPDGFEWSASYSPDGNYIVFNSDSTGRDEIYLMTAAGEDVQMLTTSGGSYPSWGG